ncbi:MAG: phenylalanine--tRNA ligase beta subunit-related protein [Planctomycetota bacterium]
MPIEDAPGLDLQTLVVQLPMPLGELPSPEWLTALLRADAVAPLAPTEGLRDAVRDLLRGHGYKPTGRGKPSSEYLVGAAADGRLGAINTVVDVGNAVSLHSGLPISVVDLDRAAPPLVVRRPPQGATYVFNRGGQQIDVGGLLCLCDAEGPCANAVKDAQRTKTDAATRRVMALVWAPRRDDGHAQRAADWLAEMFTRLGAEVSR